MRKESIPLNQLNLQPFTAFEPGGILLVVGSETEEANVMTIGWGTFGIMWGKPVVMVMVRPTRHTWNLINKAPDFTVNWLADERRSALELCGTRSGRDLDKFAASGLHSVKASAVASPMLQESVLTLECRMLYKDDLKAEHFLVPSLRRHYNTHDYHGLFYGEVIAATGTPEFRRSL